jgi:DNA-binding XRE family transcriptional regulator
MSKDINYWHPMPRYGLAAALQYLDIVPSPNFTQEELGKIAHTVLKESLSRFMLGPNVQHGKVVFTYLPGDRVDPGKKSGQVSSNGYYNAPHIITGSDAAKIVKQTKELILQLEKKKYNSNYKLKRSFAPMVAMINAGKSSLADPKVELQMAAFTAIAALTELKPAAYIKKKATDKRNTGLFPDLPFYDPHTASFPLSQFISIFQKVQQRGEGSDAYTSEYDGKSFRRPPIFQGNYHEAPRSMSLGAVPLIAAIGKWVEKQKIQRRRAEQVLLWLENRPIYSVSDAAINQERFGHHLVALALDGELHTVLKHINRVSLIGIEDGRKFNDPKWKLFLMHFDQFLRFFTKPSLQNFLAYRATYPAEFFTLLKSYFMNEQKYSDELINAAIAYGRSINWAAYISAKNEDEEDKRKGRPSRGIKEYKHRVLLQLESIVQSAKVNTELIARLNTQVGRLTMQDIPADAEPFLLAVMNDKIDVEDAKHFITAFMRVSSFNANSNTAENEGMAPPDSAALGDV